MKLGWLTRQVLAEKTKDYPNLPVESALGSYEFYDVDEDGLHMYSRDYAERHGMELPKDPRPDLQ